MYIAITSNIVRISSDELAFKKLIEQGKFFHTEFQSD